MIIEFHLKNSKSKSIKFYLNSEETLIFCKNSTKVYKFQLLFYYNFKLNYLLVKLFLKRNLKLYLNLYLISISNLNFIISFSKNIYCLLSYKHEYIVDIDVCK